MPPTDLWLVRHAQSTWNAQRRFQGQADPPLSVTGHGQARLLAERLTRLPLSAVVASDLQRCVQTAAPTAAALGLPVVPEPALREVDVGTWSGLTHEEIRRNFPGEWERWHRGEDVARGGGETFTQLDRRIRDWLSSFLEDGPDGLVLVVTHSGWIRAAVRHVLGLSPPEQVFGGVANTSVTRLSVRRGRLRLDSLNDTGHLDGRDLPGAANPGRRSSGNTVVAASHGRSADRRRNGQADPAHTAASPIRAVEGDEEPQPE